jgi:ribosomal protein S27E
VLDDRTGQQRGKRLDQEVKCPDCGVLLRVAAQASGSLVRCGACGRTIRVGSQAATPVSRSSGTSKARSSAPPRVARGRDALFDDPVGGEGGSTETLAESGGRVPTLLCGGLALALTLGLGGVTRTLLAGTDVERLFSHGLISFFTALLGFWAGWILFFKARHFAFEKRALGYDVLLQEGDARILSSNVDRFRGHIQDFPEQYRSSILFRRITGALDYFRLTGSSKGVSSYLASQGDLDAGTSESSFTMVRAFIWAIPILGFIGTVFGIGEAVNSFAVSVDSATDVEAIRSSLGGVTGGLGTAFETTLVALIMSILLMIPTNWIQKNEDELLTGVARYCNDQLLWRIDGAEEGGRGARSSGPPAAGSGALESAVSRASDAAQALSETLRNSIGAVQGGVDASIRQLAEELPKAITDLRTKVDESFTATSDMLASQNAMRERFAEAAASESVESLVLKVDETHARMMAIFDRMAAIKPKRWWRLWS